MIILSSLCILFLAKFITIKIHQHKDAIWVWEELRPQIGDLYQEDVLTHYTDAGYQCTPKVQRYIISTQCTHLSMDQSYPDIHFTSNKSYEILFIDITTEEEILVNNDTALEQFIEMSSSILSLSEQDKALMTEWVQSTIEENTSEFIIWEDSYFNGEPYRLSIDEDKVYIVIGAQIRF